MAQAVATKRARAGREMAEERCMVWYVDGDGWRTYPSMSRSEADMVAEWLDVLGVQFKIVPVPRTTIKDLLEG
ncbi:hypothetical protein [Alicyclobacillus macrosporangiidus]|uniref:hypothetical protein n=1 Tax=Alicyclobacillus macrosporangiidus TaxID=392015 RepID=UPI0004977C5A|nr:hypothetical protein [Alicyclobacillus macrosporangiidus]